MTDVEKPKRLLDDGDAERYARQIIVPDLGARGQARLCAATAVVLGEGPGASAARDYLAAAGLAVVHRPPSRPVDCVVVAERAGLAQLGALPLSTLDAPVAWYALHDTSLSSGVTAASELLGGSSIPVSRDPDDAAMALALHRIGGADAAGMAIASLLGWNRRQETQELTLGASASDQAVGGGGTTSERS